MSESDVELDHAEPKKRQRSRPLPSPEALSYSIPDACATSGWGRSKLYDFMDDGRLPWKKVDGRRRIDGPSLRKLVGA
jgi:hypothetical protein